MKNIFLLILLISLFISNQLISQQASFEYLISHSGDENLFDFVQDSDRTYIISCSLFETNNPKKRDAYLLKLDSYGMVKDSAIISLTVANFSITSLYQNAEEFVVVGSSSDTLGLLKNASLFISRMDSNFNLYDSAYFKFPENYILGRVNSAYLSNGNIIISGYVVIDVNMPRPFIYELSNGFDSLQAKFYADAVGSVSHIKNLPERQFWFINDFLDVYQIIDSNLNYLYATDIPDHLTASFGVKWDTDTSFFLVGDKLFPEPSHKIGFIKQYHPTDVAGHIFNQWNSDSDTIDFPSVWNGIDFKNKDSVFICGTNNLNLYGPYYANYPSWLVVLQTDSMLNIRWERFYGGDAYYVMMKIIATSDGGCLIGGSRYDYKNESEQQRDVIIVKLNSEGILVGNTETPTIEMHEAIVYPNPGTTEIKVRIAAQYRESLFQLFDMSGKQVAVEKIMGKWGSINSSFLQAGTYIYRISSKDGLFETGKWVKQ